MGKVEGVINVDKCQRLISLDDELGKLLSFPLLVLKSTFVFIGL